VANLKYAKLWQHAVFLSGGLGPRLDLKAENATTGSQPRRLAAKVQFGN